MITVITLNGLILKYSCRISKTSIVTQHSNLTSFDRFFQIIETLLDTYAPIEKLSRKKQKLILKPWLTKGIMTSVKKKNILYRKCIRGRRDGEKTNSLKLTKEIIIKNIFMNTKRICLKLGT